MSIASELTNLESNIGDAYDAVNDMSGIVPQHKNMANLDQAIRTIPQSQGATYTAGNGINIDANNEISIDDTVVAELSDLPGVMAGATSSTSGTSGLTPAPAIGDEGKFLKGDGLWSLLASADLDSLTTSYSSGDFTRVDIGHFHILWRESNWSNTTVWTDVGYVSSDIKDGVLLMGRWNPGFGYSADGESRASQLNSSNGLIKAQIVSPNGANGGVFLAIIYK